MFFNRKKKISIVGAGTAGIISALHYSFYGQDDFDVTLYYDPSVPVERVGQATLFKATGLVGLSLGIDWINNPIDATIKTGILYEGWRKKEGNYFTDTVFNGVSMHFVPYKLSRVALESGLFKVVERSVQDPESELDGDFIIDCRGRHNRNDDDYEPLINPLDSVLLCDKPGADLKLHYTRSVATPHGWTFVIPNKKDVSYGYLYNSTITTKEEATEDFIERFDVPEVDGELHFKNYIAKNVFVGERTMLNGNRCGFLEPLESTSIELYQKSCREYFSYMMGNKDKQNVNLNIRREMKKIQNWVLWHYKTASNFDTPFWKYAKSLPFKPDDQFKNLLKKTRGMSELQCRYAREVETDVYAQWGAWQFKSWDKYTNGGGGSFVVS